MFGAVRWVRKTNRVILFAIDKTNDRGYKTIMSSIFYPDDHRAYLHEEFNKRNGKRSSYSKRAFARDLQISPSFLVDYLNGKSALSKETILNISKILKLSAEQSAHWIDLMDLNFSKNLIHKNKVKTRIMARSSAQKAQVAIDSYKVASMWQCWAYLELLQIDKKSQDDDYAANWLDMKLPNFKKMKAILLKLQIVIYVDGMFCRGQMADVFGGSAPSEAVKKYHKGLINKSIKAIDDQPFEKRFTSSVILSVNSHRLKEIFTKVESDIYNHLITESSEPKNDSIYCFAFQFFDLRGTK